MAQDVTAEVPPDERFNRVLTGSVADAAKYRVPRVPVNTGWVREKANPDAVYPATKRFMNFGNLLEAFHPTPQQLAVLRGDVSRSPHSIMMPDGTFADQYDRVPQSMVREKLAVPPTVPLVA